MNRHLVFVHGRTQEGKDSKALKEEWIDSWRAGLAKSGLTLPIPESDIHFPYYGDTLVQMAQGMSEADAARVVVRGIADREEQEFIRNYLLEIQKKEKLPDADVEAAIDATVRERGPLNWGWVQGILAVLDRSKHISAASVALATNDVYQYLHKPKIREAMDKGVRSAFATGADNVVVSHSLGTVVAYNVLRDQSADTGLKVPLFVTLGSPLAVNTVKRAVTPRPIGHPRCAAHWFNAMDERDVVSLFPLTSKHFDIDPEIENKTDVDNPTENRHGISGYLGDPVVARRIHDALVSA